VDVGQAYAGSFEANNDRGLATPQWKVLRSSVQTIPTMSSEQSYIMIKPDGVQRGLVGEIIGRFEKRGYKLVALKLQQASTEHLEKHYADLKGKGFFPGLIKYMASGPSGFSKFVQMLKCGAGPVVAMVWEGTDGL
jgi:nucleoside-diphosphate kinase